MEKIKMVCTQCGSEDVTRNCDAAWNIHTQQWETAALYDQCDCNQCDGECDITCKPLEE